MQFSGSAWKGGGERRLLKASGDLDGSPVHIRGLRGGQEGDDLGDLLRLPEPAQRAALHHLLLDGLGDDGHHGRVYVAGQDAVDADAELAELLGGHLREGDDAGLGGRVVGLPDVVHPGHDAGEVHDAAAAQLALDHGLGEGLGHQERALQVHRVDVVVVLLRHLQQVAVTGDTRRVHHDAGGHLEGLQGRGHGALDTRRRRNVHFQGGGALGAQLLGGLLGGLQVAVRGNHLGSVPGQQSAGGTPNARAGACNATK